MLQKMYITEKKIIPSQLISKQEKNKRGARNELQIILYKNLYLFFHLNFQYSFINPFAFLEVIFLRELDFPIGPSKISPCPLLRGHTSLSQKKAAN